MNEMITKAVQELTNIIGGRLSELKHELCAELGLSSYNKTKSPIAVFNHLASIIEKYLSFVPEQSFVYATLIHLRQSELLQWLLNISIYLGTIEKPDVLFPELERIFHYWNIHSREQTLIQFYQSIPYDHSLNNRDRAQIQAMIQYQQNIIATGFNVSISNRKSPYF